MKNALQTSRGFLTKTVSKLSLLLALGMLFLAGALQKAQAQASAYVTQMEDAADQMTTDLGAVLPIALGVAVVSVGVFIVWAIFKRLARG